jgi:hypothetical protein
MTKIDRAAVKTPDGKVWAVPRPGRHDAALKLAFDQGYDTPLNEVQGFVDEEGNFYDRAAALEVVRSTGQLKRDLIGGILTSEDLWDSWRCGYDVNEKKVIGGCGSVYEKPFPPRRRRGRRVNPVRTTTCPDCGKVDALYPRRD